MSSQPEIDLCVKTLNLINNDSRLDDKFKPLIAAIFQATSRLCPRKNKNKAPQKISGLDQERQKRRRHFSTYALNPLAPLLIQDTNYAENTTKTSLSICYICKQNGLLAHSFYSKMCTLCGNFNFEKRIWSADLSGKVAIVTGARIKIGFETALKLLRAGCTVIATTRFPVDACLRFSKEPDFSKFKLKVAKLDLISLNSIKIFVEEIRQNFGKIDILINNACQTIQREDSFYEQEIKLEHACLPAAQGKLLLIGDIAQSDLQVFKGIVEADEYGQPIDPRNVNSWVLKPADVSVQECVEVHIINSIAPFLLIQKLTPLMARDPKDVHKSHIINVSSMEGSFSKLHKVDDHIHTNMAKASMNMITRTLGQIYLERHGIAVNSVDTGWIDDMTPSTYRRRETIDLSPVRIPIDVVDGAARILDPIFTQVKTSLVSTGIFFKDYKSSTW